MIIKSKILNNSGDEFDVVYQDINDEKDFDDKKIGGVHAYCFYNDKLVVVYAHNKNIWTPPGGKVEKGESLRSAVEREVKEETNMKVISQSFIGYQDITEPTRIISQSRSVCIVEPYGPFERDPDGDITEIKLIDPKDYKKYFNWGEIGDHIMRRALELKAALDSKGVLLE